MPAQVSRLHLTVTRELLSKIEAAQLALSHARPGATIADLIRPKAMGGETTVANTRLLCERHNQLAARQVFGEKLMSRYRRAAARPPSAPSRRRAMAVAWPRR